MNHVPASVSEVTKHPVYGDPVTTIADLDQFDSDEIYQGFRDGFAGDPEPQGNRSRSYWHGWKNGAVDGGHREKDDAQAVLAAVVHQTSSTKGRAE